MEDNNNVKAIAKKYNLKEEVIRYMLYASDKFGYKENEFENLIEEYIDYKTNCYPFVAHQTNFIKSQ